MANKSTVSIGYDISVAIIYQPIIAISNKTISHIKSMPFFWKERKQYVIISAEIVNSSPNENFIKLNRSIDTMIADTNLDKSIRIFLYMVFHLLATIISNLKK